MSIDLDLPSQMIGRAKVEFNGELIAYKQILKGHVIHIRFSDIIAYNQWWKVADHVHRCYDKDLIVTHFIPYANDHDPIELVAIEHHAALRRQRSN